ncbi:transposase [Edaphobacter aggregans]|uniref:transposase n=1 Tax=Edaphobacter aggregans TaxID=570835 RepID=UPI00068F89B3
MFRGKLLAFLKWGYRGKQLCLPGTSAALSPPRAFHALLHTLRRREWVVYSKPPFGGPEHVLKYLARYTHRVAISNGRLLTLDNRQVRFRWRDSRQSNRSGVLTLDAVEFIRRFLLHVLPSGFVKSATRPLQDPSQRFHS